MTKRIYYIINIFVAIVWLVNGLFCKILNLVPRHQQIVSRILGSDCATIFTKLIGIDEVIMFVWVLSMYKTKVCAITQISVVLLMNIIEFILAPDLLLFGKLNLVFASIFSLIIYLNEFILKAKLQ